MGSDIVSLDAIALSKAIAKRSVSCCEVMLAYLAQIDRVNPKVNAIVWGRQRLDRRREGQATLNCCLR